MRSAVRFLLLAAALVAAPTIAAARPGDDGGDGAWRGQGQFERGQGQFERSQGQFARGQGQFQRAPENYGRGGPPQGGYGPPDGRYGQRYPGQDGPIYAEPPPRRAQDSLGRGWSAPQDTVREGVRSGQLRPLGQVLPELSRRQPGRMLDTGIEDGPDGRPVYRVRWAARDGRRMDFIVDARTGAVLATEGQ